MPIDSDTPRSPGWWLLRLLKRLADDHSRFQQLDDYYKGENGIPTLKSQAEREAYRRLRDMACSNYPDLIVESVVERMTPVGFRTGAEGDELGDKAAWRIWQANSLDADVVVQLRAQLSMSRAAMIVGPVDDDIGAPLITCEDPREVTWETDPKRRRKVLAALKVFRDDENAVDRAYLYLPGFVFRAARPIREGLDPLTVDLAGWEWDDEPFQRLPGLVVPVVPFVNRPDMAGGGMGEFEPHLPLIDRINYSVLQRLEVAAMQAFRQRAIKGNLPTHDAEGNEIDYDGLFEASPGALWMLGDAEIWESGQVDLNPIRQAIVDDERALAAVSGTPLYRFSPDAAAGSAEGASLQREGLVFKASDRIKHASESLERVMSLAFMFAGDAQRASIADMEVLWAPPDRVTLAEKYDAAVKAQAAGETWRSVMQDVLGKSPQQIARMEAERAADALLNAPIADAETVDAGEP